MTNDARGVSITVGLRRSPTTWRRSSCSATASRNYEAGLDDDGFFDDFLSFPEKGSADQQSIELQLTGDLGAWDYVAGLYWFEEEGFNLQDPTIFLGGPGDFLLAQTVDSQAIYANVGYNLSDDLRVSGGLRYTQDEKTAGIRSSTRTPTFPNGLINETIQPRLVRSQLGRVSELPVERPPECLRDDPERLPVGPVPAAAVLPVRGHRRGCAPGAGDPEPGQLLRGERQRHGPELRGRVEGPALRQPADEHRRVLYGLLRPAVPGQRDARPAAASIPGNISSTRHPWASNGKARGRCSKTSGSTRPSATSIPMPTSSHRSEQPAAVRRGAADAGAHVLHQPGAQPPARRRQPHDARRLLVPRRHVRRAERGPGPLHPDRQPRPDQRRRDV